jgi:hypothetical protein
MRIIAIAIVALVTSAHAEPTDAPKPWASGVPEAEQTQALEIYQRGNAQFEEAHYTDALALYREAITHWDHPAIRFNMAVCLVNLDQPLEAHEDIEKALQFGATPLGNASYEQGLTYRKLLLAQLATIDVKSKEPHAEVALDGTVLFTAPGEVTKLVIPGNHRIVATKAGFVPTSMPVMLLGGKTFVADVKMTPLEPSKIVRRWPQWKPWLVLGAGVALAISGGVLYSRAQDNVNNYYARFTQACPNGCGGPVQMPVPPSLSSLWQRAQLEHDLAFPAFAVGGVALAAGLLGIYLDQPHALEKPMTVTPVVTSHAAALVLGRSF